MNDNISDLYADYLITSSGAVTATGLSAVLEKQISHDRITRMLSEKKRTSTDLRLTVKPLIRRIESPEGVLITDDSIEEKPSTDENDIICRHYDRSQSRSVRGISFMTALYHIRNVSLPVNFQIVAETEYYTDSEDRKTKRRCPVSKNEYCRQLIEQTVNNHVPFCYVPADVRYASAENMMFIKHNIKKDSVMPVKTNRKIALTYEDRRKGRYVRAAKAVFRTDTPTEIFPGRY